MSKKVFSWLSGQHLDLMDLSQHMTLGNTKFLEDWTVPFQVHFPRPQKTARVYRLLPKTANYQRTIPGKQLLCGAFNAITSRSCRFLLLSNQTFPRWGFCFIWISVAPFIADYNLLTMLKTYIFFNLSFSYHISVCIDPFQQQWTACCSLLSLSKRVWSQNCVDALCLSFQLMDWNILCEAHREDNWDIPCAQHVNFHGRP